MSTIQVSHRLFGKYIPKMHIPMSIIYITTITMHNICVLLSPKLLNLSNNLASANNNNKSEAINSYVKVMYSLM